MKINPNSVGVIVDRKLCLVDALEDENGVLAVVLWYGNRQLGLRRPEYVLPLAKVAHQDLGPDAHPFRYGVTGPLPRSLFDGTAGRNERRQYGVKKGPDIEFPLEPTSH